MAILQDIPDLYLFQGGRIALVFLVVNQDAANTPPLNCTGFSLQTKLEDLDTGEVIITIANGDHIRSNGAGTGDKVTAVITSAQAALFEPGHRIRGTCRRVNSGNEYPLWVGEGVVRALAGDA